MRRLAWLVGVCSVLMATSAYPQHDAGDVYAGAALGIAWHPDLEEISRDFEDELRLAGDTDSDLSFSSDDKVFAWNVYAGYTLNENFALEAGYLGSGKVSMGLDVTETLDGEQIRVDIDSTARRWSLYGALVGRVSIDFPAEPFLKIGMRRWDDEYEGTTAITFGNNSASVPLNDNDNGFGLLLGAGVDLPMSEAASCRIEYLYLPLSDDHGGDEHSAFVGAYYSF